MCVYVVINVLFVHKHSMSGHIRTVHMLSCVFGMRYHVRMCMYICMYVCVLYVCVCDVCVFDVCIYMCVCVQCE